MDMDKMINHINNQKKKNQRHAIKVPLLNVQRMLIINYTLTTSIVTPYTPNDDMMLWMISNHKHV